MLRYDQVCITSSNQPGSGGSERMRRRSFLVKLSSTWRRGDAWKGFFVVKGTLWETCGIGLSVQNGEKVTVVHVDPGEA